MNKTNAYNPDYLRQVFNEYSDLIKRNLNSSILISLAIRVSNKHTQ